MDYVILEKAKKIYVPPSSKHKPYFRFDPREKDNKAKLESKEIVDKMGGLMKLFSQSRGLCGPASIRIALSKFGKSYTEKEVATLAKSTASEGTNHNGMIAVLNDAGINALVYENLSIGHAIKVLKNHVNKGNPVIIDWMKTKLGKGGDIKASEGMVPGVEEARTKKDIRKEENEHYSVVGRIDDRYVYLLDPLEVKEERLPITYFMDRWFTLSEKTRRWFIVLESGKEGGR